MNKNYVLIPQQWMSAIEVLTEKLPTIPLGILASMTMSTLNTGDVVLINLLIDAYDQLTQDGLQSLRDFPIWGTTSISEAIKNRLDDVAVILINKKIYKDLNEQDSYGYTVLLDAYWRGSDKIMQLLLNEGAKLYPNRIQFTYIKSRRLPTNTARLWCIAIAREEAEKREANQTDIACLEKYYPESYNIYVEAKNEWQKLITTKFFRQISYRDIIENTPDTYLHLSRSVGFRNKEKKEHGLEFPLYNATIQNVLKNINERRTEWEA